MTSEEKVSGHRYTVKCECYPRLGAVSGDESALKSKAPRNAY